MSNRGLDWVKKELVKHSILIEGDEIGYLGKKRMIETDLVENLLHQLRFPELPAVPKLVAKYFEIDIPFSYEERLQMLLDSHAGIHYYLCVTFPEDEYLTEDEGEELYAWTQEQTVEFLFRLTDGYEVEKYLVEDIHGNSLLYKVTGGVGVGVREGEIVTELRGTERATTLLTEKEIKEFDEKYWSFAKTEKEIFNND